ncbi:hypothetical protein TELCIR_06604 [Teladorsagia circumcincta]|uniref:RRM domain-containing protein n=1 Tax=Teladorsagia circumcincta TaxID=45464 RepID=A0A2G9UML8_TELCI|nr:hypothetical protein TELCIR_06604 [Teladorsagia circumcincta]
MATRHSVYVGNLPYQTSEEAIGNHFSQAGNVTNVRVKWAVPAAHCAGPSVGLLLSELFCSYPVVPLSLLLYSSEMATRHSVYVGNLPYQTSEEAIGNHFSQAGNVTNVRIVYDRETGRMKGFGFCEFSDEAGAQNAVDTLNGADFNGRQLRVNYANKN